MGTSLIRFLCIVTCKDHPHACGDKACLALPFSQVPGSSPRVWGQDKVEFLGHIKLRIIPTRVGTSSCHKGQHARYRDHPHACGDKYNYSLKRYRVIGSSPRVWGQVHQYFNLSIILRIIPTRVGTRDIFIDLAHAKKDHPHACGDKVLYRRVYYNFVGSSPRVWGQD